MINRTENFWLVGFFLSKYGNNINGRDALPPIELGVSKWNEAYYIFYDSLSGGRTVHAFEHSLKNARDAYDSHLQNSPRIGWRDEQRAPRKLEKTAELVFSKYAESDREEIWKIVQGFVSTDIKNTVVNDISTHQESTGDTLVITKTEGGKKAFISYRCERNLSLRSQAFKLHGYNCAVCGFNFEQFYGLWGKEFGEVHHLQPLSDKAEKRITNPLKDLIILCSNCHRMIHRKKRITLTLEELRRKVSNTFHGW